MNALPWGKEACACAVHCYWLHLLLCGSTLVAALSPRHWKVSSLSEHGVICQVLLCMQTVTTDLLIHWKSRFFGNSFFNHTFWVYSSDIHYSMKKHTEKLLFFALHPSQLILLQQYHWQCFHLCQNRSCFAIKHIIQWKNILFGGFSIWITSGTGFNSGHRIVMTTDGEWCELWCHTEVACKGGTVDLMVKKL